MRRLEAEHPAIFADWKAGKYSSARKALEAAGLRRPNMRLNALKNAWAKATAKERADFLLWTASPVTSSSLGNVVDKDRRIIPAAAAQIRTIMDRRGLKMGDVMSEMGFKRLDPSLGNALSGATRLRPDVVNQLEKWLDDNRTV
jgi:antitoxin component HigA of HigAB toxin-antitoxin module